MVIQPALPEIFEHEPHSSIDRRTDDLGNLRELGPPDLVHLVKYPVKGGTSKQFGVYHHVTGIDASSSASLAAYINTLSFGAAASSSGGPGGNGDRQQQYKVVSGLHCSYNAFSRLDMRVQVQIPGGVEAYCINERGEKLVATDELWLETYLCSVLRAYSYADDGSGDSIKKIVGVRRFNPITSTEAEHRFLDAAERLFFAGWQLGSDPEIQVPNLVSNHLTTGLLEYIKTTGRYASGINLFEKLRTRDPEISSLLARVYIEADREVQAVQLLHETIEELPMDYSLLDCQAEFVNRKGRGDLALEIAKRSVVSAPSEFGTWARLAEIYVGLERWDLALLTLNSCPMFTYQDKDAPRMPEPARVSLPILPETMCDEIDDAQMSDLDNVAPGLRKLVAFNFKGTFLKAYSILTDITKKIGWDQLLKIRSQVFVMEEEYRHEKQTGQPSLSHSRNASTAALPPSPGPAEQNGHDVGDDGNSEPAGASDAAADGTKTNGEEAVGEESLLPDVPTPHLEKPASTIKPEVVHAGSDEPVEDGASGGSFQPFKHKRLCERWLDNLFMVLYDDLRYYTIWRTEMAQYREQQLAYKKSPEEWELLGELAERLHHHAEATEAYQACLGLRFSPKAMKGVLGLYEKHGESRMVIGALIRLICWQYRWYSEFSPSLLYTIRRLIEEEGAVKVHNIIHATSLPEHVLELTHQYTSVCEAFHSSGTGS